MRIRVQTRPHHGRFLRSPGCTVAIRPVVMDSFWVTRVHWLRSHVFRPRWWGSGSRRVIVIHPWPNDNRVCPSKGRPSGRRWRYPVVEAVITMSGWRGWIYCVRSLLLRSVDCQRLLDLLKLFPLFSLLLALDCPTPLYPFHLLTTPVGARTTRNTN